MNRLEVTVALAVTVASTVWSAESALSNSPKLVRISHPHDSHIIAFPVEDLTTASLDPTGRMDASQIIGDALEKVRGLGGGTVFVPSGIYRMDNPIRIPAGVGLRGEFQTPSPSSPVDPGRNTILAAYYGREEGESAEALVTVDGSASIDGLVFWYPEQSADDIKTYAPTVRHTDINAGWAANTSSRNLLFVNSWSAIQIGTPEVFTVIQLMKNIYGSPLGVGIEVWKDADIPRILEIDFSPEYWSSSGLPGSPAPDGPHARHILERASGVRYHRCDGSELANLRINGYRVGLELLTGHQLPNGHWIHNEGHYVGFDIRNCQFAVWIENIKGHGTQFYRSRLHGLRSAIHIDDPVASVQLAMFLDCEIIGGEAAISSQWDKGTGDNFSLIFTDCRFSGPVVWNGGALQVLDSRFSSKEEHLRIGRGAARVALMGNEFEGGERILTNAPENTATLIRPRKSSGAPEYSYRANLVSSRVPEAPHLVNTRDFGVLPGTREDIGPPLQAAMDAAARSGGGYVYLPSGEYFLESPIFVPPGVEVRGAFDFWHHSKFTSRSAVDHVPMGTTIHVSDARDQMHATISLRERSGVSGISFHHPGIAYDPAGKRVFGNAPWLFRLEGRGAYLVHVTAINPWRFAEVTAAAPDAYIGFCNGAPLSEGIRSGETDGLVLDNVHFNSWYWNTVAFDSRPTSIDPVNLYTKELDNWMKANTDAFTFAGTRNIDVYGTFIFCTRRAFTLLPGEKTGRGPSGIVINSGNDWSKFGLHAHANDGLDFVNMHFICVNKNDPDTNLASIHTSEAFGDSVRLFNVSTWGTCPRAFSLHGKPESHVEITNFSYYLYVEPQVNQLAGGHLEITNAIRRVAKLPMHFEFGTNGTATFSSFSFPEAFSTNLRNDQILKSTEGPIPPSEGRFRLLDVLGSP